ncbi:mycofactocin biosynthesis glycosyltransferase MftF [Microbacterium murale]|uniref:Mycofactocin biosynthesis glycosyltransferase MftF n=1 Tax=Microbacterium murale TaxID=1081040 RepID=A0ABQ1RHL4_9MICO|nr:mycofactocin biosynthesis glycosyltransferase MftF [Microbacterium murale]GGD70087.1 putative mycofactocin biosynthesis glycosyltransferase MftF [Microbacterium murale]
MTLPLPIGFVVALNHRTKVRDGGRTLVGGSPTRLLHLSPAARAMLIDGRVRVADHASATFADRLLETGIGDPVADELPGLNPQLITWVIPVRDRPAGLDRLLESITSSYGEAKIIVVDDGSIDPAATERISASHGAETVLLTPNLGVAAARNAGLAKVTTPFVAFVDSDVTVNADTMQILARHFADPRVVIVAPRVVGVPSDRGTTWVNRYEDARSSLDLGGHPGTVRPRALVSWVSGTTLLCRVDGIGDGFAADMRSGEDVDIVWRAAEQGRRVRYEPAATVLHEHRSTALAWMKRKAFYGTGAFQLGRRHPGSIAPAILPPWAVALVLSLIAQRRWSLPLAAAICVATTAKISRKAGRSDHPRRLAAELTMSGAAAAVVQGMALLLRHWWPAVVVLAVFSKRLRRAVLLAHLADVTIEFIRLRPKLDPVRFASARRLDDLAYGAGVWFAAIRGRSYRSLMPDFRDQATRSR